MNRKKFRSLSALGLAVAFSMVSVGTASAAVDNTFIKPTEGSITSGFGSRTGGYHYGTDIAKSGYVKVIASAPGTVRKSEYSTSYGNVIYITHNINGTQYETVYAHLENRAVSTGDSVYQGQVIGNMGNTGDSTGQHLHFEVHTPYWTSSKTYAKNPLNYIPTREGKFKSGSFTYHVGTDTIYPISYNGNTDITVDVTSSSATNGEYRVYLQRQIDGVWTNVGHIGAPKNGSKTMTFTREYSVSSLYQYTQYRILLDNVDTTGVNYTVWYE